MNILNQAKLFNIGYLNNKGRVFKLVANHLGNVIRMRYNLIFIIAH